MILKAVLTLFSLLSSVECFESALDESLYAINWHDSLAQSTSDRMSMVVTTNNNEKYQCLLPNVANHNNKNTEDQFSGVQLELELLRPLIESRICSYRIETYWTYEMCHGRSVRQFHEHHEPPSTQEYYLGYYTRGRFEADLTKAKVERQLGTSTKSTKRKKVYGVEVPYYEITHTDGTQCDLTGQARKTHVQYVCNEDGGGELYDIKETSSCEYEAVVLTKDLCRHPNYGTKKDNIHDIDCHPLDSSPTRPLNYQRILQESMQERFHQSKFKLIDSLWDVVYSLADEEDEEEIIKITSKKLGKIAEEQESQKQQPPTSQQPPPQQQPPTPQPPPQLQQPQPPSQQPQQPHQQQQQPQLPDIAYKDVLHSFLSGDQCITGGNGWWKHEICYKRWVKQFHQTSEGREEILLGQWSEEGHLQWAATAVRRTKHDKGRKYIYNYYGDGDFCNESQSNRSVLVRLECIEGSSHSRGIIIYLIEASVCSYELVVQSAMFCDVIDSAHEDGLIKYP